VVKASLQLLTDDFVQVLGVRFHRLTRAEAVERMLHWMAEASRRLVITAGPEFVMQAMHDEELKAIAYRADLVTADGIGIVWAAKRKGQPVPERVTGVELVHDLLQTANERKQPLRVFVLGATEESLQSCLAYFRRTFPHLTFGGRSGYFRPEEKEMVISQVAEFAPNLWLVGLGQPRQEKLIFENLGNLPPCVAIGVGGSIDVWGGTVKRAPVVFQKLNIEWLYRLLKQPSRWRRQLALPRFVWQVLKSSGNQS
jgi:N-acetylglucosaminyldiphosphoundecaprenol N-acetyl-beta-D-mannosaminyltransferase